MLLICRLCLIGLVASAVVRADWANGEDYFLTVGGGYSPTGNQVSLEKNVLFYQRMLAEQLPNHGPHDIYFADGLADGRDLQFAAAEELPQANWLMAQLFGDTGDIDLAYRNHHLPGVRGRTSERNLDEWFDSVGSAMASGDRLILYVTAHGGKSRDKKRPFNTRLYLWDNEHVQASDLAKNIERLSDGVQVIVVMVQCYSGGFATLLFEDADQEQGMCKRDCIGFFATVHDRVAAGCTADIDEENYQEYSSDFWAAIGGKTRTNDLIEPPDFDKNGHVSFDEAHAYVMLHSDTIDIPTKTSGMLLRTYSKLGDEEHPQLLNADTRYDYLLSLANPAEAAMLVHLTSALDLSSDRRAAEVKDLAEAKQKQRRTLNEKISKKKRRQRELKRRITSDLKRTWPELENVLSVTATALLTTHADEFVAAVTDHSDYTEFARVSDEIAVIEGERFNLQRQWAKCRRVERVLENIALARNLPHVAMPEIVRKFERTRAAEESSLHQTKSPQPRAPQVRD